MTEKKRRYVRKVIRITAADSPNVAFALQEQALGLKPSGKQILPGVLSWDEYRERRATWHPIRQCVGLDAQFWEGKENLLFPPEWLNRAEEFARTLRTGVLARPRTTGASIGIDTAEGGDNTAICVIDRLGVLELHTEKTADTSVIPGLVKRIARKWSVPPSRWVFDAGGGGTVHANLLRSEGFDCRTVAFGGSLTKKGRQDKIRSRLKSLGVPFPDEEKEKEERYVFLNKRAEMYYKLRLLLDPTENVEGFAVPPELHDLRYQMAPIPLLYDGEGRIFLPPKRRRAKSGGGEGGRAYAGKTLEELVGRSPDELDALVLAVEGLSSPEDDRPRPVAGPAW